MTEKEGMAIAEQYLQEMLKADDTADFELYTKRFESQYLTHFTKDRFQHDIKDMHERNGANKGYEFLATLRPSRIEGMEVHRTVWKGIYEKRDAVIELVIYKKNDTWHIIQSAVH